MSKPINAFCLLCVMTACLAGCVTASHSDASAIASSGSDSTHFRESSGADSAYPRGSYDFDWRLSGSRQAGPTQVFSTPDGIWLSFGDHAALPVIFGVLPGRREVLLRPVDKPPYLFVEGTWRHLLFRSGDRWAQARHVPARRPRSPRSDRPYGDGPPADRSPSDPHAYGRRARLQPPIDQSATDPSAGTPRVLHRYVVSPEDINMRRALTRWSGLAGWTFAPEHWTLDADIPLTASADLGPRFQDAVTALMAATELSDRPAQPCFYANRVLRIIAMTQQCDPRVPRVGHVAGASS